MSYTVYDEQDLCNAPEIIKAFYEVINKLSKAKSKALRDCAKHGMEHILPFGVFPLDFK